MSNPLYKQYSQPINDGGLSQIIEQAKEMRKTFNGNPRQEVERLLKTGEMSQKWFNQYFPIAQQIGNSMRK